MRGFFRAAALLFFVFGTAGATGAAAPLPVTIGTTAVSDFGAAYVAAGEGMFARRGLAVTFKPVALNSGMPAALRSGAIDIGGPTAPVLLRAVDQGEALVALAGGTVTVAGARNYGLVVRADGGIAAPRDLEGRTVGVPGTGALLDVLFRKWLADRGVDARKVTFVDIGFPRMAEAIERQEVDAVVSADPVMRRIIAGGAGKRMSAFAREIPGDLPAIVYAASAGWVAKHADAAAAFREAIAEAVAFIAAEPDKARAHIGGQLKMTPQTIATMRIPALRATLTADDIARWDNILLAQGLLKRRVDPAAVLGR